MNATSSKIRSPRTLIGAAVVGLVILGGCAQPGPRYPASQPVPAAPAPYGNNQGGYGSSGPSYGTGQRAPNPDVQYGHVENIELVKAETQTSGAGAVIGGVLGAVLGNQVGKGSGRTAATGVGAVGGALIGNQVEKTRGSARDFVRVSVRLDRGGTRQFDYEPGIDIRQGDRVYVQGDQLMRY